jgi:hypothetical protein
MRHRIAAGVTFILLSAGGVASAQTTPEPPRDSLAIGATGSIGWFGRVGAIRASVPLDESWGFDLTVGHIRGRGHDATASGASGASVAAQFRWMRHGRTASGRSGHWLFGAMRQQGIERTEIRFPGSTIVQTRRVLNVTPQFGYGWDRLLKNGARFGIELSTGGNERGPSQYIQTFVTWGPRRPR